MEFYTLEPSHQYNRATLIDQFESAIWTERFIEAGDVKIVVPATHELMRVLMPGTLLMNNKSREIMVLDTREIQNGAITVSGKSIEAFFQYRYIERAVYRSVTPRRILASLVQNAQ